MSDPEPPSHARSPRTVWSRPVDHDRQRVRMRRLLGFYVLPCAALAVGLAVVLSPGEALGFVILAGVLGLLLGGWVLFQTLNERANARIVLNDGTLVFGQKVVPVAEVESFTTVHTSTLGPDPLAGVGDSDLGKVVFRLSGGREEWFGWPAMSAAQLDGVRVALEPVLPGRWRPPAA